MLFCIAHRAWKQRAADDGGDRGRIQKRAAFWRTASARLPADLQGEEGDMKRKGEAFRKGRSREGSSRGSFIITLLLVVAIGVFAFSGWKLFGFYLDYKQGSDEYSELNDEFVKKSPAKDGTGAGTEKTGGAHGSDGAAPGGGTQGSDGAGDGTQGSAGTGDGAQGSAGTGDGAQGPAGTGAADGSQGAAGSRPGASSASQEGALTDVAKLEDPAKLTSVLDGTHRESTLENGETKSLPKLVNPVDFAQLQRVNPEVIGWIRVGAVNVSYPVTQAKDNDYYLHRTFKKVDNFAGCIFENCANSPHFTDQNTIIYGHNMKNGSMFGQLKKFSEQETLDKNPYFWIFTKDFIYQYRIFSSSVVSKIGDPYITRFSKDDYQKFIDKSIASSEIDCGDVKVTTDDRIVTLSTCTGNDATRRIVQGVLVQVYIAVD